MHYQTPTVSVVDPRALTIRSIDYWREVEGEPTQARINRTLHNAAGHPIMQWDPRLWSLQEQDPLAPANLVTVYSLSGVAVSTLNVDAGSQISLLGLANEVLQGWDSRGTQREIGYDELLRPVKVFERVAATPRRCVERMEYGRPGQRNQDHNAFGQLIRQDGPGGTVLFEAFAITGECTKHVQHFTLDAVAPDWPELTADRNGLLERGDGAVSTWRFGPLGHVLESVDARQNSQTFGFTLDGRLRQSALKLTGKPTGQILVSEIEYNAQGQITREVAGNNVQTTLKYCVEDGRLLERRAHGDQSGLLQHLLYAYDRMGNVLSIEDKALPVRYFNNQRIEPVSRFIYDSLYQLIAASGREAGAPSQGPESVGRNDPAALSNYQQTYSYDESGNLLKLAHIGVTGPGRDLKAARYSNRCLPWRNGVPPTEEQIDAAFDARGNLLELDPGRFLKWGLRNQLQSVNPVERDSGRNDVESYLYDGGGQRVRKTRALQTNARTVVAEVRYLPGLDLRTDSGTGKVLQVITAQAGLNSVQVLRWEGDPPTGVTNDQYRYSLVDHLSSCTLELGDDARIISREAYYPFGATAWSAGANDADGAYKTIRYSGKERDATGLYYYGLRYYIPWLQRWANPDPAGPVEGLNLFRMLRNSPINHLDANGTSSYDVLNEQETFAKKRNIQIVSKGIDSFPAKERDATSNALELGLDWVRNAEKALSQPLLNPSTQKILTMMFDEHDFSSAGEKDSFTSQLRAEMRELKSFMTKLLDEQKQQIILVDQLPRMDALAFNTANDGNFIWVSRSYIERSHEVSQARTMVHEASHAMRRNNASNFVNDFMYLNFGEEGRAASKEDMGDYVLLGRLSSNESMGIAPDESKFGARALGHYKNAVNSALEKSGESPATSPGKRAAAFLNHVKVRQSVALRNADSLSVFAMQFRR